MLVYREEARETDAIPGRLKIDEVEVRALVPAELGALGGWVGEVGGLRDVLWIWVVERDREPGSRFA
jgi:hypothetical protein